METRKLYYASSHLSKFSARVLSCEKTEKGYAVILDATAFYPEGGGQASDTGTLGTVRVLHTRETDGQVIHLCDGPLEPGTGVEGTIDYAHRFGLMQQHSGEHMVSGIIHRRYGYHNTGFHVGSEMITIDFDGVIPPEDLPAIEAEANGAVWQNLPVRCWIPEPEELEKITYPFEKAFDKPFLKEFTLKSVLPAAILQEILCSEGIFAGVEVEEGLVNFCVTEKHSKEELDRVVDIILSFVASNASSVISSEYSESGNPSTKEE